LKKNLANIGPHKKLWGISAPAHPLFNGYFESLGVQSQNIIIPTTPARVVSSGGEPQLTITMLVCGRNEA
jgi:hypothetical protein